MIKQYCSPLEQVIKQKEYEKHLKRIDHILKRNKTADYYLDLQTSGKNSQGSRKQKIAQIQASNEKLFKKLQQIRARKGNSSVNCKSHVERIGSPFQKRQKKRIEEQNMKMIDKMISMKCANSYQKIRKDVAQYNKIKNFMKVNKSVSVRLPSFKTIEMKSKILA